MRESAPGSVISIDQMHKRGETTLSTEPVISRREVSSVRKGISVGLTLGLSLGRQGSSPSSGQNQLSGLAVQLAQPRSEFDDIALVCFHGLAVLSTDHLKGSLVHLYGQPS
jgi:hypothetical protein